jgi:hypothetical protein
MKTILPTEIKTIDQAKAFLSALSDNGEDYHPEDNANEVDFMNVSEDDRPTVDECFQLNKLMDDIYNLPGNDGRHDNSILFCPCGYLLDIKKEQEARRVKQFQNEIAFLNSLISFRNAANKLLETWHQADHTGDYFNADYPFKEDFETVVRNINTWMETQSNTGKH